MTQEKDKRRNTFAVEPEIVSDQLKLAEAEAANGLRQFDAAIALAQTLLEQKTPKFRASHILALHREALANISAYA